MRAETKYEDFSDSAMEARNQTVEADFNAFNTSDTQYSDYVYTDDADYESQDPQDDPNYGVFANLTAQHEEAISTKGRNLQGGVPPSWDWRRKGAVTYVRNQGVCGACWAFTTVANVEGLVYNKYGVLKALSEQQLVDCNVYNSGCSGGTLPLAFNYVRKAGGLQLNAEYPYQGYKGYCRVNYGRTIGALKGYVSPGMNEDDIKNMLYTYGPLSAAMNSHPLYYYVGGVFNPSFYTCNPYAVNHGITIVGYGTTKSGLDYWVIKNSWGPNWGERGFFRLARGTGACGINRMVYSGVLN